MNLEELTKIKSVFIYSLNGTHLISHYYSNFIPESVENTFEKSIFKRALDDQFGEIMQHDEYIVIYKLIGDVFIFVVGGLNSNELLLAEVADTMSTALSLVFKGKVDSKAIMKQIDLLYLLLDETIEQGLLFEGDPEVIAARTKLRNDGAFLGKAIRAITGF